MGLEVKELVLVFIAYTLISAVATYPLVFNFSSMIFGTLGDPNTAIIAIDVLAKNNFLLTGNSITQNFGAPFGTDIKHFYFVPFIVYLLAPISAVTGATVAYNLIQFLSLPLGAIAMYLFSKRFVKSRFCSFIAGFLFSFYPLHLQNTVMATLVKSQTWVIPLFVFALLNFDQNKNKKNAFLLGIAGFVTAFFSYYHFFFALLFTAIFYIYKIMKDKTIAFDKRDIKCFAIAIIAFSVLFLAFIAPLLIQAREAAGSSHASVFAEDNTTLMKAVYSSAYPEHFVIPPAQHPVFGQFTLPFLYETKVGLNFGSIALYIGITTLLFAAYALFKKRNDKKIDFLLFSAIALFILATGLFLRYVNLFGIKIAVAPLAVAIYLLYIGRKRLALGCVGISAALIFLPLLYPTAIPALVDVGSSVTGIDLAAFSPEEIIEHLDKYNSFPIPMPSLLTYSLLPAFRGYLNLALWVIMFVSLIAVIGIEKLASSVKDLRKRRLLLAIIFCIMLFEFLNVPPPRTTDISQIPEEYEWLKQQEGNFIVAEYPLGYFQFYLYCQPFHGKRLFNSYYTKEVRGLQKHLWDIREEDTAGLLSALGVKYVIMHDENLYKRVPETIVERITAKDWYKSEDVDAVQLFMKENPLGTEQLKKVKQFKNAAIFEVRAEPDKKALDEILQEIGKDG